MTYVLIIAELKRVKEATPILGHAESCGRCAGCYNAGWHDGLDYVIEMIELEYE